MGLVAYDILHHAEFRDSPAMGMMINLWCSWFILMVMMMVNDG
jgi:hypothetical protein